MDKEEQKRYSLSLVEVLAGYRKPSLMPKLLCMVDNQKNIERRIKMIKLGEIFKKKRVIIAISSVLIIGIVSVLFLTTGADKSALVMQGVLHPKSIDTLPKEYTAEMAVKNGDYVNMHGIISNDKVMESFLDNVSKNKTAFIRKTGITIEGDAIIADISFENNVFNVTVDTTRDNFGNYGVKKYTYKNMIKYHDNDNLVYILTNLFEITDKQYENWRNGKTDIGYELLG